MAENSETGSSNSRRAADISDVAWCVCVLFNVTFWLYIISYSTPYWASAASGDSSGPQYSGLWQTCGNELEYPTNNTIWKCTETHHYIENEWSSDWLTGVQTLATLALVSFIAVWVAINIYIFTREVGKNPATVYIAMCCTFASFGFTLVVIIIYGINIGSRQAIDGLHLDWSYYMCVFTDCSMLLCVCLLFVEYVEMANKRRCEEDGRPFSYGRMNPQRNSTISPYM